MKVVLKFIAAVFITALTVVVLYAAYLFISYHRLGNMSLTPMGSVKRTAVPGEEYLMVSWNIGFGAYESDYSFFMDGGKESRARSPERLDNNLRAIADLLAAEGADYILAQEVDTYADRTFRMDEREYLKEALPADRYVSVFAQNFDSPYLFYPLTDPHGASESGIETFSRAKIKSARRIELPVEAGVMKILDLDRCYSVSRIPTEDGREFILYNVHLSAYTSDGTVATEQLRLLVADMQAEYEKGNICVAGGDFNKDLLGDSTRYWKAEKTDHAWAKPVPTELFDGLDLTLVVPFDENDPVPSCRNADAAYHEGQFVLTVDGFIVSDNVEVLSSEVIDTGFAYSDHNPVRLRFSFR